MNYAVLVGINVYQNGNNLQGCCNDVDHMFERLVTVDGYKPEHIVVLKDEAANKANIVDALIDTIKQLKSGDDMFFHFSGHGSQVLDSSCDEVDGKDELLCPHDMNWPNKTYITDDELRNIFSGVPCNTFAEIVLDCCHSGTGTRQFSVHKNIPSPANNDRKPVKLARKAFSSAAGLAVVWAGCDDGQTSSDAFIAGKWQGAFTYYWLKTLAKYPNLPRKEVLAEVKFQLNNANFGQVPQLEVTCNGVK